MLLGAVVSCSRHTQLQETLASPPQSQAGGAADGALWETAEAINAVTLTLDMTRI